MKRGLCVILAIVLLALTGCVFDNHSIRDGFESKLSVLASEIKSMDSFQELSNRLDDFRVFLSVSDGVHRCKVYSGYGDSLDAALSEAGRAGRRGLGENAVKYLKLEILYDIDYVFASDLVLELNKFKLHTYRKSIAFDDNFSNFLLESEFNSAGLLDYGSGRFNLDYINAYFAACGRGNLSRLPDVFTEFVTYGYFCDENNHVYALGHDIDEPGYQRRVEINFDDMLENTGKYLANQVLDNGRFVYGYYGYDNYELDDYNILRHAGVVWALINYYRFSGDESVMSDIDVLMGYLISQVVYHDGMAFIYDAENDEIKLGSSGLGLIALVNYIEISGRRDLLHTCRQLADGILYCLDDDWTFNHVYDSDLNLIEKTRTVYYDGEAAYGLCRLYDLTGDEKYLDAVESVIKNNFIANHYETIGDHWVAYALNSYLKSCWDSDVFLFALRNITENLDIWDEIQVFTPARFEACANLQDIFKYAAAQGHAIPDWFDINLQTRFENAVNHMLNLTLDGLFWPEIAMTCSYPERISYGFFDRTDYFRARIDDTQHSYNGLMVYMGLPVSGRV